MTSIQSDREEEAKRQNEWQKSINTHTHTERERERERSQENGNSDRDTKKTEIYTERKKNKETAVYRQRDTGIKRTKNFNFLNVYCLSISLLFIALHFQISKQFSWSNNSLTPDVNKTWHHSGGRLVGPKWRHPGAS
jgi:hypothetical protein